MLGKVYLTEVKKKDILAGLDFMSRVKHIPIYITMWTLADYSNKDGGERITHPEHASRITLDQAVRQVYQTDELQQLGITLSDNILNTDIEVKYAGVRGDILMKLLNYLKKYDGTAVFTEPHTENFYVLGLDKEATEEETENVFYQTIEDMEDLKTSFKKNVTDLNDLQNNEPD